MERETRIQCMNLSNNETGQLKIIYVIKRMERPPIFTILYFAV